MASSSVHAQSLHYVHDNKRLQGTRPETVLAQLNITILSAQATEGFSREEERHHDDCRLDRCHVLWGDLALLFDWNLGNVHGDGFEEMILQGGLRRQKLGFLFEGAIRTDRSVKTIAIERN